MSDLANMRTHARPCSKFEIGGREFEFEAQEGITLRQHYAGLAMQGLLAHYGDSESYQNISQWAVDNADSLISELSK